MIVKFFDSYGTIDGDEWKLDHLPRVGDEVNLGYDPPPKVERVVFNLSGGKPSVHVFLWQDSND